jgi:hypothetical protein
MPAGKYKNKIKTGNDGKQYVSLPDKNGVYKWKLYLDIEGQFQSLTKKLYRRLYYDWWHLLASGSFLVIYTDSCEFVKTKNIAERVNSDPDVKYVVWSGLSADNLIFFIYYLLKTLPKSKILKCMNNKGYALDLLVNNPNKYLTKSVYQRQPVFTKKDYVLKDLDHVNEKAVLNKMKN